MSENPRDEMLAEIRARDAAAIPRMGNPDADPLLRAEMDRRALLRIIDAPAPKGAGLTDAEREATLVNWRDAEGVAHLAMSALTRLLDGLHDLTGLPEGVDDVDVILEALAPASAVREAEERAERAEADAAVARSQADRRGSRTGWLNGMADARAAIEAATETGSDLEVDDAPPSPLAGALQRAADARPFRARKAAGRITFPGVEDLARAIDHTAFEDWSGAHDPRAVFEQQERQQSALSAARSVSEALHRPDGGVGGPGAMCVHCTPGFGTPSEDPVPWPCPTIIALRGDSR